MLLKIRKTIIESSDTVSEEKYLTVTALTKYLKRKFDVDPHLSKVHLVAEVSNFRLRPTHQYFSLKDDGAKIKAICFQNVFKKAGFMLEEGMKVLVIGRISLYESTGEYQIYIEHLEMAGAGALFQAYKQLKEKLTKEGLFSAPKKAIPRFPKRIAIVTSQSGAVIHDIQQTILRRYPIVALDVYPTVVQGKESASSIVNSLRRIMMSTYTYDTVIIARGGGSIEDLWSFNEEEVVRAIYECSIPVISSVGHETDTTLTDYVADLRVPTPTAAAECAVPVLRDVLYTLDTWFHRLTLAMNNELDSLKKKLYQLDQSYVFTQPERLYDSYVQKLDYMHQTLSNRMTQLLLQKKGQFDKLDWQFEHVSPTYKIDEYKQTVDALRTQLLQYYKQINQEKEKKADLLIQKLDLLSPLKSMSRGYSYVTKENKVVSSVHDLKVDEHITITLVDGQANAVIQSVEEIERRG
ncbi:exodeoxyribonuclease VII large subunit [Carnobacteriaceae bacterium zg-84]|nr:exodeoxyribonuclease VII large subunit [Granulicatella sp. zg-84]QMI85231.1 exodeoxyribonuclease VII large subunit [Carnobacteriaceae bacterium zg-84]